jgi:hypothetical protein
MLLEDRRLVGGLETKDFVRAKAVARICTLILTGQVMPAQAVGHIGEEP